MIQFQFRKDDREAYRVDDDEEQHPLGEAEYVFEWIIHGRFS
jgi:hypothetical protein